MIKYKCPKCGASCKTSHCFDCDKDIPMSCRYDDSEDEQIDTNVVRTSQGIGYKCPICGATCRTSHCYDCDRDIPMATSNNATWHQRNALSNKPAEYYDVVIGKYISIDHCHKRFKIQNDSRAYKFSDLINFELYEKNSVIQEGGVGRAIVGGMLFGEVGAIVGAQTRKSRSVTDALYIRLTLKSSGMKTITFTERQSANEVLSELELIVADNRSDEVQTTPNQQSEPQPAPPPVQQSTQAEQSPTLIADELLKLKQLLDMGVLTQEEFDQQKQKLLNG